MTKPSAAVAAAAMEGTFTRSRAEIYVHLTRSGHRRSDPSHLKRRRTAPLHPPPPHVAIKDLRAHRVFSPRAAVQEKGKGCDTNVSSPGSEVEDDSFQATPPDLDIIQPTAEMIDFVPKDELLKTPGNQDACRLHTNTLKNRRVIAPCSRSKLYRNPSSFGYRRLLPYLLDLEKDHSTAESTKGSPTKLFCESIELNEKPVPGGLTSSSIEVAVDDMIVTESPNLTRDTAFQAPSNNSQESSGIVLCSRSKLYQDTRSFGYRRLMPYLLDLEKDISGGTEILHPQVYSTKAEKNREEKPLLLSTDPSAVQKDHTIGSEGNPDATSGENLECDANNVPKSSELSLFHDVHMIVTESSQGSPNKLHGEIIEPSENGNFTSRPLEVAVDDMIVTNSLSLSSDEASQPLSRNSQESSGIAPGLRSKLYPDPRSFGYRRLLPFLLDLEKDISGGTEILHPLVDSTKSEKNAEEKPFLQSTDRSAALNDHTIGSESKPDATSGKNLECVDNNVPKSSELSLFHDVHMIVTESSQGSPNKLHGEIIEPSEKNVRGNFTSRPLEVAVDDMIVTNSLNLSSDEASQPLSRNSQESSGFAPGLRSKLYPDPRSFGYRRLLPFLLDLEKDISGGTEILHPLVDSTKSEKKPEEKPFFQSTDPSAALNDHTIGSESKPDATSGKNLECDDNHVNESSELSPSHDVDIITIESTEALPTKLYCENIDLNGKHVPEDSSSSPPEVALDDMIVTTSSNLSSENAFQAPSRNSQESSGIALCSRSKLYRNPSSFGYRRLLPYLRDLEKEISGGTEILHPHLDSTKTPKNTAEKPLLPSAEGTPASTSGENLDLDGNHVHESSRSSPFLDVDMIAIESTKVPPTKLHCDNIEPNNKHVPKNSAPSPLEVTPDDMIVTESHNQSGENACNAPKVASAVPLESSDLEFLQSRDSSFYSPTNCGTLSVKELSGNILDRRSFSLVEEGCCASPSLFNAGRGPLPVALQLGKSGHLGNHALAPKKGILKRNTRGCIGLCMCLDCASFRLHADRSHEFSRRQILEADEVVTGLTKELSCLRHIIEKSDASQIKEVCQRALRVEELAKTRMQQMINEMNSHYRLPGPRVRFAERIEERSTG